MNVRDLLASHPFSRGLSQADLSELASHARVGQFPEGSVVFREGAAADALYLISSGRVALEQHVPGKGDFKLENLAAGDMLGLSWLFPGSHWSLAARAVESTEALVIDAVEMRALMDGDPALGLALAKHVVAQLYQRLERVRLQRLDVYRGPR